ncbi:polysaccharide deacetylase family protein [Paenibacillus sp. sgz500958]|uniref:polysaccharide deacetylase family protein n=1 Tax=Paenibacillus sp. sgz500958 TaxID=3242475 RepID=UPI0036D22C64
MGGKKVWLLFCALIISVVLAREATAEGAPSLRLGVNDQLTEIEAIPVKGSYYVPLRDLAQELTWTLTGQADGIDVQGSSGHMLLALKPEQGSSITPTGLEVQLDLFQRDGKLMIPIKVAGYLGYTVSYKPVQYVLRVSDASAQWDDDTFAAQFKDELKPVQSPANPPVTKDTGALIPPGKTVYLTFDDGPTATTGQLLDILSEYHAKATFFMLGPNMTKYPNEVKRMVREQDGMGLHGISHRKEKFYASPSAALAEMDGDNVILNKLTGIHTTLIRTPYGSKPYFTKIFRDKVLLQGYALWDWNVDSLDWKYKEDSNKIYSNVMNQIYKLQKNKVNPVILMHDQKTTLKVLPLILETLNKEGYQFQIISKDMNPLNFWKDER